MIETPAARDGRGAAEHDRLAVDQQLARLGLVHAGQDLDQRRLAGTVLAEQRVRLAGVERDRAVLESLDGAEALDRLLQHEQRREPSARRSQWSQLVTDGGLVAFVAGAGDEV